MKRLFFLKTFTIFIIANFILFNSLADNFNNKDLTHLQEYLDNLNSLEADFFQVSSDGNIKEGKIYLRLTSKEKVE